ncbi:hypothetical protein QJQ45_003089 [Haematococcus lacustris]|nr:hypothetical protein QJQ45_003089 [Haematococcus lacustris]
MLRCRGRALCKSSQGGPGTSQLRSRACRAQTQQATPSDASICVKSLKSDIRSAIAGTERGKTATPLQHAAILGKLTQLEALNAADAAGVDQVSGWWALLYQGPLDPVARAWDRSVTLEGPFLAALQPLNRGVVRTAANLQHLDLAAGTAQNITDFVALGRLRGSLNIRGTAQRQAGEAAPQGKALARLGVEFTSFELKLGSWSWTVPLTWVRPRDEPSFHFSFRFEGQLHCKRDGTDEEWRVARGDKGSIFLVVRAAEALKAEGNALFAKERYGAAIDRFTEAICLCPDMAALYVNRALCHKKLGDSAHALEDAEKAVQRDTAYMKSDQAGATPPHPQPVPLQALETARAHNDSIKDEVWRELAKAQYAQWQADSSQRQVGGQGRWQGSWQGSC